MELLLLILGALFILFGFIGSFLPVVPGLPISLLGILIMQWTIAPFSSAFIWGWSLLLCYSLCSTILYLLGPAKKPVGLAMAFGVAFSGS